MTTDNLLFPEYAPPKFPEPVSERPFVVGDRVQRSPRKYSSYPSHLYNTGIIVDINNYNQARIKWDEKAATGQQHSTINIKHLIHERRSDVVERSVATEEPSK